MQKKTITILSLGLSIAILVSACSSAAPTETQPQMTEVESGQITESPLPTDTQEPAPTEVPQATATELIEATETLPPEASETMPPEATSTATSEPTTTVPTEPILLAQSSFYGVSEDYKASGNALIYENPDGSTFVRLENFEVTSGPDLHVILAEDDSPYNLETLGDYADLGELQSTSGDQEYAIPAGTDLDKYGSVVIYCVPFHAIFAIAPVK
jgi:hypothetical protein